VLPRDAGEEALFLGGSEDNETGGGTVLGARVEAHGSTGGAVSEKKIKRRIICIRNRER